MTQIVEKHEASAELLKVAAHPVRLALVEFIIKQGTCNVTTMYNYFGMPQSTISQHLAKMKSAKIVQANRKGLEIFYEVTNKRVKDLLVIMS